jgi:hypothetical protein
MQVYWAKVCTLSLYNPDYNSSPSTVIMSRPALASSHFLATALSRQSLFTAITDVCRLLLGKSLQNCAAVGPVQHLHIQPQASGTRKLTAQ